jgi:hypothetical protein
MPSLLKPKRDDDPHNACNVAQSANKPILPVAKGRLVLRQHAKWQTANEEAEETDRKLRAFAWTRRVDFVARPESRREGRLCTSRIEGVAAIAYHGGVWGQK